MNFTNYCFDNSIRNSTFVMLDGRCLYELMFLILNFLNFIEL